MSIIGVKVRKERSKWLIWNLLLLAMQMKALVDIRNFAKGRMARCNIQPWEGIHILH